MLSIARNVQLSTNTKIDVSIQMSHATHSFLNTRCVSIYCASAVSSEGLLHVYVSAGVHLHVSMFNPPCTCGNKYIMYCA